MLSSGANVIIWCYHVMLSSGMLTPPFFIFPGNFTHSCVNGTCRQFAAGVIEVGGQFATSVIDIIGVVYVELLISLLIFENI